MWKHSVQFLSLRDLSKSPLQSKCSEMVMDRQYRMVDHVFSCTYHIKQTFQVKINERVSDMKLK